MWSGHQQKSRARHAPKLIVDAWQERIQRVTVTTAPTPEELGQVRGFGWRGISPWVCVHARVKNLTVGRSAPIKPERDGISSAFRDIGVNGALTTAATTDVEASAGRYYVLIEEVLQRGATGAAENSRGRLRRTRLPPATTIVTRSRHALRQARALPRSGADHRVARRRRRSRRTPPPR